MTSESETLITESATENPQQASETQGSGGDPTPTAEDKLAEERAQPEGAPDKYEFKAPDGQTFDDSVIGAYSEIAKELNLSQASAQKMLDKVAPVIHARQVAQFEAVRSEWSDSSKADKEIGGEKLAENLAVAKKALDTFGTPALRTLLNETGVGNHPELIRAFYRAGKTLSEDKFVGGKGATSDTNDARSLYPNSNLK